MTGDIVSARKKILESVAQFQKIRENAKQPSADKVKVSGMVYDSEDLVALVDSSLDFWLTAGRYTAMFERGLCQEFGLKHALFCNSGSSANLIALSALTTKFMGAKRLKRGHEVITSAASFPTTVNPIFQNGLTPVFVDAEIESGNIDIGIVEEAITEKTRAVIAAHTLGNPFDSKRLAKICKDRGLFLIEDCCDALGAKVGGKPAGTYGDFATLSFYPAHHITTGEGGAVLTDSDTLKRAAESIRDWGRDCWCRPGADNTCGKRFCLKMGGLPHGYDHKYTYSTIGYNLKATDMQAAVGTTQLKKLGKFMDARNDNFRFFEGFFRQHGRFFIQPKIMEGAEASPFGYLVNIRDGAPFDRGELVAHLEKNGIATRMLFGGNMVRQPAYEGETYRIHGTLGNSDHLMNMAFWIGVYPGITHGMRQHVAEKLGEFLSRF